MRVLFDYQAFQMQRVGGVSRSYAELISHLWEEGVSCKVGLKESDNAYLKLPGLKPLYYTHNRYFKGKKWFKGQRTLTRKVLKIAGHENDALNINQEYCIKLLKQQQFDVFEPTYFDPYFLPYLNGKPFVLTVHDMIPELLEVDRPQAELKQLLCPLAAHIHVPSQHTKDDLIRIMGIPSEKITVIPHGAPITPPQRLPILDFPYLLYVGARWSYKNFELFITECAEVVSRYPELNVVCTGDAFSEEELQLLSKLKLQEHVINVSHVSDEQLQALYQHAVAFVYPSAYEGFGIPILEAFVNGCPVLLNNASCFPEIGGDAAIYFDIKQKGDLAEHTMELLQYSDEDRQQIIDKGTQRAKCFSWEASARKLMQVYETIHNHS